MIIMEKGHLFSNEQIQVANQVNLEEYLKAQGETLTKSGQDVRWDRYSSVTIRGNQYYRWKNQSGGYPIQFLKEFYGYNFRQAMELLLSFANDTGQTVDVHPIQEIKKEFILPERNENMRRVYGYLINARFIDRKVIKEFVEKDLIYEDKKYHNIVFVGYDEERVPRHAHKRTTYSNQNYRGNVAGSDPRYTFHYFGSDDSIYVFEAPIDMLSYITLHNENWQDHNYIALNGLGTKGLEHILDNEDNQIKKVFLCFDNDVAGIEGAERVLDALYEREIKDARIIQPKNKDFNEDLKELFGVDFKGSEINPKYDEMKKTVQKLMNEEITPQRYTQFIHNDIINLYAKMTYTFRQKDGQHLEEIDKLAGDILRKLLEVEHSYSCNEPFTKESDVWNHLTNDYRSYKDHGNIEKYMNDAFKELKKITELKKIDKNHNEIPNHYRTTANLILNMKLEIRREIASNMEMKEKYGLEEKLRPDAKMIGEDGNVFNLMGICTKALNKAGYPEKAKEMNNRIMESESYNEALAIMSEYVNPCSVEESIGIKMKSY